MSDKAEPTKQDELGPGTPDTQANVNESAVRPKVQPLPEPTLAAYYGKGRPRVSDWIKAVRAQKLTAFTQAEVDDALTGLADSDFDLRKTLALASLPNTPSPVRRWVAEATQSMLRERLPKLLFDPGASPSEQIGRIAEGLRSGLHDSNKRIRSVNEHLLQLALLLILKSRPEFDAISVLMALFRPLRPAHKESERLAAGELRQRVLGAGVRQLRDLGLVQASGNDRITNAERARREAEERALNLMATLQMERDHVRTLKANLEDSQRSAETLAEEVTRLRSAIEDGKQIGAHSTAELFARFRTVLAGRLSMLLGDASDALGDEPPTISVAKGRVKSARSIIDQEVAWLDESSG